MFLFLFWGDIWKEYVAVRNKIYNFLGKRKKRKFF